MSARSIMRADRHRESRVARLCLAQSSQSPEKAAARELLERSPGLEKKRPAARISGEDTEPSDRVTVIRREPTREKLKTWWQVETRRKLKRDSKGGGVNSCCWWLVFEKRFDDFLGQEAAFDWQGATVKGGVGGETSIWTDLILQLFG